MNIVIYGNGPSKNHGCEAIVRGTANLLAENNLLIRSIDPASDFEYGLNELAAIEPAQSNPSKKSFFLAYLRYKLFQDSLSLDYIYYEKGIIEDHNKYQAAFSVGGDNYCYGNPGFYAWLNSQYKNAGLRTVLWGCSIEPDVAHDQKVQKDLRNYDLIVAREPLTYKVLKEIGANAVLAPDPAFYMESRKLDLDSRFFEREIIGINASPVIVKNEKNEGIAVDNYIDLINEILKTTDAVVALIPHVTVSNSDDRITLNQIKEFFPNEDRIILVDDHDATELKYIISKCSFFVGSRTHSTIAAYSSEVPTIAVGYSIKAKGIAQDLFGEEGDYVVDVRSMEDSKHLLKSFQKLYPKREQIREKLKEKMDSYLTDGKTAIKNAIQMLSKPGSE